MQMDQNKNNFGEPGYNTIKKKLHGLEDFKDQASHELNDHHERLRHLETQSTEAGDNTSQLLQAMHDKILAEFKEVQDEFQHRLSSQVAENKRLQSHLTNQKNEMQAMHKRILSLEDRVKHLELDIGEDEK